MAEETTDPLAETPDSQGEAEQAAEAKVEAFEAAPAGHEKVDEKQAAAMAEPEATLVREIIATPGLRLQDHANFAAARRDEAHAAGVEWTTQERMYQISRAEEAAAQGVAPHQTTAEALARVSRVEEIEAGKREEALFGRPLEPEISTRDMGPESSEPSRPDEETGAASAGPTATTVSRAQTSGRATRSSSR